MATCTARMRDPHTQQLRIKCTEAEAVLGSLLCARHSFGGCEPRLPPRFTVEGKIYEEEVFYQNRSCTITLPNGQTRTRPLDVHRCDHVVQTTVHGAPDQRCVNSGPLCWPFCPTHLIHNLHLWPDVQLLVAEEFQLGLFAFKPGLGEHSPVFVRTAQLASSIHYSAFPSEGMVASGRPYYPVPCASEQSMMTMQGLFGTCTMPYTFKYTGPCAREAVLLDTTFRRSCITLANTTTPRSACNVNIVDVQDAVAVALCALQDISNGDAIFVNYLGDELDPQQQYAFDHLPHLHYAPPFPARPAAGTLYDFARASGGIDDIIPRPAVAQASVDAGMAVQQTKLVQMRAAMQYFDTYTCRLASLPTLPFLPQCQAWLQMLAHALTQTHTLGVGAFVDRMLARGGDLFLAAFHTYCRQVHDTPQQNKLFNFLSFKKTNLI